MNVLFIHQNFPGQYWHLAQYLSSKGHKVMGLGCAPNIKARGVMPGITTVGYPSPDGAGDQTHHYLQSVEAGVRRGQAVARCLLDMKTKGYRPDVISVHPGWGEALFLRDVFPNVPILMFCEFYFRAEQADQGFDPEFAQTPDWSISVRMRNTTQIMSLLTSSARISPSRWQASRYPDFVRERMHIIPDGVHTEYMSPDPGETLLVQPLRKKGESRVVEQGPEPLNPDELLQTPRSLEDEEPDGNPIVLSRKNKVVVFISRNLEPYRGYHIFLRTLPAIQEKHPDAHILIIGNNEVSYSTLPAEGQSYKEKYLDEVRSQVDLSRIHFLGHVSYADLRSILRVASAHVYLTYPFVLSWSALESMACGGLIIGSDTEPVREVISNGNNGLLVNFFDTQALADTVDAVLQAPERFDSMRSNARSFVEQHFRLEPCLHRQALLLEALANGFYPNPS